MKWTHVLYIYVLGVLLEMMMTQWHMLEQVNCDSGL